MDVSRIKALRPGFDGMLVAIDSLPKVTGNKVLTAGRIKFVWTSCRVKKRTPR